MCDIEVFGASADLHDTYWSPYTDDMLSQHPQPPFLTSPALPQTEPPSCQDRLQHDSISSQISSARVALVCPRKKKAGPGQSPRRPDDPVVLTRELLEGLFDRSLAAASEALGICPTAIKKACRRLGIDKWPFKGPAGRSSKPPTPPSSSTTSGGCVASVEVSGCEDLPLSSHGASSCLFETAGPSDGTACQDLSMSSTFLPSSNCWEETNRRSSRHGDPPLPSSASTPRLSRQVRVHALGTPRRGGARRRRVLEGASGDAAGGGEGEGGGGRL